MEPNCDTIQVDVRCAGGTAVLTLDKTSTIQDLIRRLEAFGIREQNQRLVVEEEENEDYAVDLTEDDDAEAETSAQSADDQVDEEAVEGKEDGRGSYEYKKKVVDYYNEKPGRTFKSVKQRFRRLTSHQFTEFKKHVAAGGTRTDKWRLIDEQLMAKFNEARKDMLPVHDNDLRRWALEAAGSARLETTTISSGWLMKWKRRHRIVSRKVSKVWSSAKLSRAAETEAAAVEFRREVLSKLDKYDPDMIFNTDQSGFQYEFYSGRTLSFKGEQATPLAIKSMNKTTHSYTVQPTISLSGKLMTPLYICTQEVGGKMGPRVKDSYFKSPNVVVTCSASGKLTTSHCTYYVQNVLLPMLTGNALLLLDSWGGQQADECFDGVDEFGFTCERMCIPPGATPTTQPLDVFYNRQWKQVVRRFYDHVMVQRLKVNMYERDNVLKMQSLVHHMFSHDRFVPMGQFAFFASGLRPDRPDRFESAVDVLFPSTLDSCERCPRKAFIKCVYCDVALCFKEFFGDYHNHFEYNLNVMNMDWI